MATQLLTGAVTTTPPRGVSRVVSETIQAMSIRYNNMVYELKDKGVPVIALSSGEEYFDIPLAPMDDLPYPDLYHYSHSRGILDLRKRVARYYDEMYGVPVDPESEIIVTAGSKAAIHFSLMSVLDPGDEVLLQEPTWVSYPEQAKFCYARPVLLPYDASLSDYERHLTERTKLIIITNPHNPRGQVLSETELRYVVDLARANGLYVLADEAYSDFVLDGSFRSLGRFDAAKANVIVCNSISKNLGKIGRASCRERVYVLV